MQGYMAAYRKGYYGLVTRSVPSYVFCLFGLNDINCCHQCSTQKETNVLSFFTFSFEGRAGSVGKGETSILS